MDLKKTGCEGVDWIHLAQGRVQLRTPVNTVMNLEVLDQLRYYQLLEKDSAQ
jgi:hypothetical protein